MRLNFSMLLGIGRWCFRIEVNFRTLCSLTKAIGRHIELDVFVSLNSGGEETACNCTEEETGKRAREERTAGDSEAKGGRGQKKVNSLVTQ